MLRYIQGQEKGEKYCLEYNREMLKEPTREWYDRLYMKAQVEGRGVMVEYRVMLYE